MKQTWENVKNLILDPIFARLAQIWPHPHNLFRMFYFY